MQHYRTCAFFGVLVLVAEASLASLTSRNGLTTSMARQWLQKHPAAQEDELAELKSQNPEAYAIVKALLTKRSLGLLDPKHPTASFAAPPPASQGQVPSGAAAFAKFASPSAGAASQGSQSVMYPDAPAPPAQNRDWFSWKPADSAANDDAMVQNVLGAVAELKGQGAPTKSLLSKSQSSSDSTSSSALEGHEEDFEAGLPAAPPAPENSLTSAAPASEAAPATTENSYLKGMDFGMKPTTDAVAATKTSAAAIQGNSYLRGINLESDEQPATVSSHDHVSASAPAKENYLSSFSWGDEGDSKPAMPASPARLVQKQQAVEKHASDANALTSWLLGGKPAVVAAPKPVAEKVAPAAPSNPYTTGLW